MAGIMYDSDDLRIELVSNGYIVHLYNEKFVFSTLKQTLKFVEEFFITKKEKENERV